MMRTMMFRQMMMGTLFAGLVLGAAAAPAQAASITYAVHVDTTGLAGTQGYLDLQFLPGGFDALAATATVTGFNAFDTTLTPPPVLTGDASGALPGDVTLGNSGAFNDYFHGLTFGNQFSFFLTLTGDALSPVSPPLSGTAFSLLLFGSDGFTPLLTADPDGRLASLQIGPAGQVGVQTFARPQGGDPAATVTQVEAVPEPATMWLMGTGVAALIARRVRSRSRAS
jgi:hypothetical protein